MEEEDDVPAKAKDIDNFSVIVRDGNAMVQDFTTLLFRTYDFIVNVDVHNNCFAIP